MTDVINVCQYSPGRGNISHNENFPYVEGRAERGTFLSLQVYKRVGISQVEAYEKREQELKLAFWLTSFLVMVDVLL